VRKEREREAWELQNYPAGEIAEMVELFVARGMSREDASFVIQRSARAPACPLSSAASRRRRAPPASWLRRCLRRAPLTAYRTRRASTDARRATTQWPSTKTFSST
jgi:hypothetical protein